MAAVKLSVALTVVRTRHIDNVTQLHFEDIFIVAKQHTHIHFLQYFDFAKSVVKVCAIEMGAVN